MTGSVVRDDRQVLLRAARLLRSMAERGGSATLSDLVDETGLAKATAHRLMSQLMEVGFVRRDGRRYEFGIGLFELGSDTTFCVLRETARPFMEDLRAGTHETVHLAVLDGVHVLYVERLVSHESPPMPTWRGHRNPAYATGAGKAILAYSPDIVVEDVIADGFSKLTPRTIKSGGDLRKELITVRGSGIAYDRGERLPDIVSAAAPIFENGEAVGAVSVTGPMQRLDLARMGPAVRAVAAGISRSLSYRRPRL